MDPLLLYLIIMCVTPCVGCPQGRYGANCAQICNCRDVTECHHITGVCSCHPGYTGDDCRQGMVAALLANHCNTTCL